MRELWRSTLSVLRGRSDEEAMSRVGIYDDNEEFARLMRKWEEPIRRLCTRMTGDRGRGEDLKQETFLRLFRCRGAYQPSARFSTFLWRIAVNLCRDEFRKRERERDILSDEHRNDPDRAAQLEQTPSEAPGPDVYTAVKEESRLVQHAVLGLPEIYRTVVVLRHYENLKLKQIAEILELPEGTVNSRMAEALMRLHRLLEPRLKPQPDPKELKSPSVMANPLLCYESPET